MDLPFAEFIMIMRKRMGLSEEELAKKANVSRNSISMIERGKYNPTIKQLRKITDVLGYDLVINFMPQDRRT